MLCIDLAHRQLYCTALLAFNPSVALTLHYIQNFKLSFALISITLTLALLFVTLTLTFAFAFTLTLIVRYDRLSLLEDATATSAQNGTGTGTGIGMVGVINGGDRSSAHMKERTSSFVSQSQSESHIKSSPNGRALSPSDMDFKYPKSRDAEGVLFGNRGDGIAVKNLTVQPGAHTPLLDTKKNGNGNGNGNGKSNAKGSKGYGSNN
jgi:hypothetical protein